MAHRLVLQSTCSVWSKTAAIAHLLCVLYTSIHLLRVEQDGNMKKTEENAKKLQSTCSVWSKTHRTAIDGFG